MEAVMFLSIIAILLSMLGLGISYNRDLYVDANEMLSYSEIPKRLEFSGSVSYQDFFKLLLTDKDYMLVGARNKLHNISLVNLQESLNRIEWTPTEFERASCIAKGHPEDVCQNYIQVLGRNESSGELLLCGTNAYKPLCRKYKTQEEDKYLEINGLGKCPLDPTHNSTFVYSEGKVYAATYIDYAALDSIIMVDNPSIVRTKQHDSRWLNDPKFVQSFDHGDHVYFFLRETAIENINCGKTVFSRVARVCKKDRGGVAQLETLWTTFFKARFNCSMPGEFPYYFNEIQAVSDLGQGNYMSTTDSSNRTKMIYGIFSTPENSVHSTAICAYRFSDIANAFRGRFKEQKSVNENWLPVPLDETPVPHPAETCNNTGHMTAARLQFLSSHWLMDDVIPAAGGAPIMVKLSLNVKFTKIAVDWQIRAADRRYYDILFLGTDDGRVLKVINKGHGQDGSNSIESVVIEDLQIFKDKEAVTEIKIYSNKQRALERLVVMSRKNIVSIPLHRCEKYKSCSECVALQDPYCSWVSNVCAASDRGLQNIPEGISEGCAPIKPTTAPETPKPTTSPKVPTESPLSSECNCPCAPSIPNREGLSSVEGRPVEGIVNMKPHHVSNEELDRRMSVLRSGAKNGDSVEADRVKTVVAEQNTESLKDNDDALSVAETAIAVVVAIVCSAVVGFIAGYKVRSCRGNEESDEAFINEKSDIYGTIQKRHRSFSESSSKEPRYVNHTEINNQPQKQSNLLVDYNKDNNIPNGNAIVSPVKQPFPKSTDRRTYV